MSFALREEAIREILERGQSLASSMVLPQTSAGGLSVLEMAALWLSSHGAEELRTAAAARRPQSTARIGLGGRSGERPPDRRHQMKPRKRIVPGRRMPVKAPVVAKRPKRPKSDLPSALGGITVLLKLPHLISTAHLVNALLILAGLIVLARGLPTSAPPRAEGGDDRLRRLARVGLIVLLVQLALGGYVRHSGAGLACPDFPLCSGDLLPTGWLAGVHWAHRWLGVLLLGLFIHVAVAGHTAATRLVAALAVLQVALGIAAVLLQLTPVVRAAHAAVGYALWAALVWVSVEAGCWRRSFASPARAGAAREAVHAA